MKPSIAFEPTRAYTPASSAPPAATRCRIAAGGASGSRFRDEIVCLLRTRLRLVVLIILLPMSVFLAKNLLDPDPRHSFSSGSSLLLLHTAVAVAIGGFAVLLWSRVPLCLRPLRAVESILFGLMALFFAWIQWTEFCVLYCGAVEIRTVANFSPDRLLMVGASVRWFFLIVIYGVFIPNTWRRCLLLCSLAALFPLGLGLGSAWHHDRLNDDLLSGMVDLGILMVTGVAVAVFGTYRLRLLQEQAFTAEQLGQYRLKKKLGAGGMGEVYLAEHTLLRRPCALKLIRPEQAGDPTTLHRFEREVQAMATLTHWNTVEVFDYGHAQDGTFYYVMEYLPGQNLETLVQRHGPLAPGRAVHFLRQMCQALREAHGIGLLHRDIKPSNIIACTRGAVPDVAKLLDFGLVQSAGLAGEADRLTVQGTILGSPPYMSPEQAAGKNDLDARSDIYSVGGVAYFLLTGQPPFVRETAMEMLLAHAYEAPVPPSQIRPEVPADLEAVVLRCLTKKPAERYQIVEALDKALAACECAGDWSEEEAAAWWKREQVAVETAEQIAAVPTLATSGRIPVLAE